MTPTSTSISTTRFGELEISPEAIIKFPEGMIGFENSLEYTLVPHSEESPFVWLQSVRQPDLAFLLMNPEDVVPDYAPTISGHEAEQLGLSEETPRLVYTVVTIPPGKPEDMTINLAGPLVINAEARTGRQIVLDTRSYPVRHRVHEKHPERKAA